MVVSFLAAAVVLVWVQRRWGRGSRFAYLGLPLVALRASAVIASSAVL